MTEIAPVVQCSNPICEVARSGACGDGLTPQSCPKYGKPREKSEASEIEAEAINIQELATVTSGVPLPSGDALSISEAADLLKCRPASIIAIVGERGSGKTTLISTIYGQYLKGPFAGHSFAESRTLLGFEELCHLARLESGATSSDTLRTTLSSGIRFYHLRLKESENLINDLDLLLSDRAGEHYAAARNKSEYIAHLIEIKRAKIAVFLLDGDRVSKDSEFSNACNGVQQLIRAFIDAGILTQKSRIQIITTKTDVWAKGEIEDITKRRDEFLDRVRKLFSSKLREIEVFDIAARDPTGQIQEGLGVDTLLSSWIDEVDEDNASPKLNYDDLSSEFDLLMIRQNEREEF